MNNKDQAPADKAHLLEKRNETLQEEMISAELQIIENDAMIIEMRSEIQEYRQKLEEIAGALKAFPAAAKSINDLLTKYPQSKIDKQQINGKEAI